MVKYSRITYTDSDGSVVKLSLPTIQNVSIPDADKIPEHATVTGQYRQQFTKSTAPKPRFTVWLEDGSYGDESINTKKVMDALKYLKDNRVQFNLTTSHGGEENRFLSDLVIENVAYNRDVSYRNRLIATINCTKLRMTELEWEMVDVTNVFGYNIFTGASDRTSTERSIAFEQFNPAREWHLDEFILSTYYNKFSDMFLNNNRISIPRQVGNYVENNPSIPDTSSVAGFKLTDIIELSSGEYIYSGSARFTTSLHADTDYTCTLLDLEIEVNHYEVAPTDNLMLVQVGLPPLEFSTKNVSWDFEDGYDPLDQMNIVRYLYSFADTYPTFTPTKSFEYTPTLDELAEYFEDPAHQDLLTTDKTLMSNGYIYTTATRLQAYDISQRYSYTIRIGDYEEEIFPTGSVDINCIKLNTVGDGYKLDAGNYQSYWDEDLSGAADNAQYEVWILPVTVGTMLQVYVVSPTILKRGLQVSG